MSDLKWKDAVVKVLKEEKCALHYTEIAEAIAERGYRSSLGATPQDTVSSVITTDINANKENSLFVKVDRGIYTLKELLSNESIMLSNDTEGSSDTSGQNKNTRLKVVNAFGIYWSRDKVEWKNTPDLLGVQQLGATPVNFKEQRGVYLLHDHRETIYIGQATEQPLGQRLRNHTTDRLGGRWDRFSWFGFYPVNDDGSIDKEIKFDSISIQTFGDLLEAILIESLEPRQNRKQGNLFAGLEYLQVEAPEIKKRQKQLLLRELSDKL